MYNNRIFSNTALLLIISFFCLTTISFASLIAPVGLTFNNDGPTAYCNVSGTFTQYEKIDPQENSSITRYWSPTPPTDVYIGYTGNVTGYGYADMEITYTVGASDVFFIGCGPSPEMIALSVEGMD